MDNKKLEDIMKEMLGGVKELNIDDLASVSGGAMTPEAVARQDEEHKKSRQSEPAKQPEQKKGCSMTTTR